MSDGNRNRWMALELESAVRQGAGLYKMVSYAPDQNAVYETVFHSGMTKPPANRKSTVQEGCRIWFQLVRSITAAS
jgi:hypothetical protein